jgi:hypothetical protein
MPMMTMILTVKYKRCLSFNLAKKNCSNDIMLLTCADRDLVFQGMAALFVPVDAVPDNTEEFPDFIGNTGTEEHKEYLKQKRAFQLKRSRAKSKKIAQERLEVDRLASLQWLPISLFAIPPAVIGMLIPARWMCEQLARGWAARDGVQHGISIKMNHETATARCRTCSQFSVVFNYQPSSGQWKLNTNNQHMSTCLGVLLPSDVVAPALKPAPCKSAYTANQVARIIHGEAAADPSITTQKIRSLVVAKGLFSRLPPLRFFGKVKNYSTKFLQMNRVLDMASLTGYALALRRCGHKVGAHKPI